MDRSGKVVIVSQHYPPDASTTAGIMSEIANYLATEREVLVLSGSPGKPPSLSGRSQPTVIQIKNRVATKDMLMRRAAAELLFTLRAFAMLLVKAKRGDVVLTVTAPFVLPYGAVAVAKLKGARSALIMHDLFPDVLVMAGLVKPKSVFANAIRAANEVMFHWLDAVITVGRDAEKLLLRYGGIAREKIHFIPNWATLASGLRPLEANNHFRPSASFVVGLSGNLGFTHDPLVVFEAARRLRGEAGVHFLLSGWGIGFERLKEAQSEANLPNVTLVERVSDESLEHFLAAADVWLIPYRKNVAGVSVPSRFYNLLAVGRPVILISEPDAEAALTVAERKLGWVVPPDCPELLVETIRAASASTDAAMCERAVFASKDFNLSRALEAYASLIDGLLSTAKPLGRT